jgi:nitrous-oxide reductase
MIPVHSFSKMLKAIETKQFSGEYGGIPILKYEATLHGEVQKPGLGPLHTEFDGKGNAYTSMFVSSEVVKWDIKTLKVLDRQPTFYSVGHLMVAGGDTSKPFGKYLVAYNKITKDRFLPTGPELTQSAQLFDISGDKMKLLLDFPTFGAAYGTYPSLWTKGGCACIQYGCRQYTRRSSALQVAYQAGCYP